MENEGEGGSRVQFARREEGQTAAPIAVVVVVAAAVVVVVDVGFPMGFRERRARLQMRRETAYSPGRKQVRSAGRLAFVGVREVRPIRRLGLLTRSSDPRPWRHR